MRVGAFDRSEARGFDIRVAGPAALPVSKLHKIADRAGSPRASDKDAYDVLRLLRGTTAEEMATRIRRLRAEPLSLPVTEEALGLLGALFRLTSAEGSQMAARAASGLADPAEVTGSCVVLAEGLLMALGR